MFFGMVFVIGFFVDKVEEFVVCVVVEFGVLCLVVNYLCNGNYVVFGVISVIDKVEEIVKLEFKVCMVVCFVVVGVFYIDFMVLVVDKFKVVFEVISIKESRISVIFNVDVNLYMDVVSICVMLVK